MNGATPVWSRSEEGLWADALRRGMGNTVFAVATCIFVRSGLFGATSEKGLLVVPCQHVFGLGGCVVCDYQPVVGGDCGVLLVASCRVSTMRVCGLATYHTVGMWWCMCAHSLQLVVLFP